MPLFSPYVADFQWQYSNVTATRLQAPWGFAHTTGVNPTFSAYTTLVSAANITQDVYGILLIFNNAFNAATTRNVLVNIGVDTAGGTTFVTKIPNLMCGHSGSMILTGGIQYYFPLYIPSGSSIGIQATGTAAFSFSTAVTLFGQPRNPDGVRVGSYVTDFGVTLASARGTTITPGLAAEGLYAQIGATTTRDFWWWQLGYSFISTNVTAGGVSIDMAAGSSTTVNKLLLDNVLFFYDGTERIWNSLPPGNSGFYNVVGTGENIYMRAQTSGAAPATSNVMAYGLGG